MFTLSGRRTIWLVWALTPALQIGFLLLYFLDRDVLQPSANDLFVDLFGWLSILANSTLGALIVRRHARHPAFGVHAAGVGSVVARQPRQHGLDHLGPSGRRVCVVEVGAAQITVAHTASP